MPPKSVSRWPCHKLLQLGCRLDLTYSVGPSSRCETRWEQLAGPVGSLAQIIRQLITLWVRHTGAANPPSFMVEFP